MLVAVFVLVEGDVVTTVGHEHPDLGSSGGQAAGEKSFLEEHISKCGARRKNKKQTVVPILLSSKGYVDLS